MKWCTSDAQRLQVKSMVLSEVSLQGVSVLSTAQSQVQQCEAIDKTEPPAPKKSKMAKLFSFMEDIKESETSCSTEEELQVYLKEQLPQHNNDPLTFWKENGLRFPQLAELVKKFFIVPATSAPVERVFSHAGNILSAERARLLPKNFENLVFLKVNQHLY